MEPRVLYEAKFELDAIPLLVPLFFFASLIVFLVFVKKKREKPTGRGARIGIKVGMIVSGIMALQMLLVTALLTVDRVCMYQATIGAYQRGEYRTVEGYVTEFDPMPASGHAHESFTIDSVYFEYSDYVVQFGYHNAKSRGGVITGDGQHLKIGYTEYSWLGNVIVYIEELP